MARRDGRALREADLYDALPKGVLLSDSAFRRFCLHEAGHVIAGLELASLSGIVPTGATVRRRVRHGSEHRTNFDVIEGFDRSRESVEANVVVFLAGLAAEEVVLGSRAPGQVARPDADLVRATQLVAQASSRGGLAMACIPSLRRRRESGVPVSGTTRRSRPDRSRACAMPPGGTGHRGAAQARRGAGRGPVGRDVGAHPAEPRPGSRLTGCRVRAACPCDGSAPARSIGPRLLEGVMRAVSDLQARRFWTRETACLEIATTKITSKTSVRNSSRQLRLAGNHHGRCT